MHSALEKRHWVRVTGYCNNRCVFCLDRDSMDGVALPFDAVVEDLRKGIEGGAARAIVSGGEASIHPQFVEIVAEAKRLGYRWVQTITNGRMFCYHEFTRRAVEAGLDEVTFSLHAHTPELFDKLTGVPGSFQQAIKGLKNALSMQNLVVSVDIVVNRMNAAHLADMVEVFRKFGVGEFDLLYPVPFGGAWENREELLPEPGEFVSTMRRVFEIADRTGITVWTNRFPPIELEGYERFIQPPEKVYDEVAGRRPMFEAFLADDIMMPCFGERCYYCAMKSYCDLLIKTVRVIKSDDEIVLLIRDRNDLKALDSFPIDRLGALVVWGPQLMQEDSLRRLVEQKGLKNKNIVVVVDSDISGNILLTLEGYGVIIEINGKTAPYLITKGLPELAWTVPSLMVSNRGSVDEVLASDTSLPVFFKHYQSGEDSENERVVNVPPCVSGKDRFLPLVGVTPGMYSSVKGWDLDEFTRYYVLHGNYHRSARCAGCVHEDCPGLHINRIRAFGFGELGGAGKARREIKG